MGGDLHKATEGANNVLTVEEGAAYGAEAVASASNSKLLNGVGDVATDIDKKILGPAGIVITAMDAATSKKGWQTKHTVEAIAAGISLIPVVGEVWAPIWYSIDIATKLTTGKTISEHIQDDVNFENANGKSW